MYDKYLSEDDMDSMYDIESEEEVEFEYDEDVILWDDYRWNLRWY